MAIDPRKEPTIEDFQLVAEKLGIKVNVDDSTNGALLALIEQLAKQQEAQMLLLKNLQTVVLGHI